MRPGPLMGPAMGLGPCPCPGIIMAGGMGSPAITPPGICIPAKSKQKTLGSMLIGMQMHPDSMHDMQHWELALT